MLDKKCTTLKPRLYNYFRSSSSYRVRLALNFKGIEYEYIPIHLLKNEQNTNEFKKLNPMGQVPCWTDGQMAHLAQSMAILIYLENQYPHPPLLPKEASQQAQILEFCEMINTTQPLHNLETLNALSELFGANEEQKKHWTQRFLKTSWAAIEVWLTQHAGAYCYHDQVTLADCLLLPHAFASKRFGIELNLYPRAQKIIQNLLKEEWVKQAHPHHQPDTPTELRGQYEIIA